MATLLAIVLVAGRSQARQPEAKSAPPPEATETSAPQAGAEVEPSATTSPTSPPPPVAPPAAFSGNSSASALWHTNNHDASSDNDNYGFVLVRHSAMIDAGDTRMSVRVDHENVLRNPQRPDGSYPDRRNSIRIERVALEVNRTLNPLTLGLTAGDFYAQFGRGLVLALRKYDELGLDFALRGGRVQAGLFDDRVTGTVVAGFANINNIISETEEFLPDPRDRIGGANLEVRPTPWLTLAAQGALVTGGDPVDDNGDGIPDRKEDNRILNTGGGAEVLVGSWSAGAEYARQVRRPDRDAVQRGSALFATATGPVGPLTVLAELKDYRQFSPLNAQSGNERTRVLYSAAPTAERIDQEIIDNSDVTGGRLRVDMSLDPGGDTAVHASYGYFRYRYELLDVHHGFAGVRRRMASGGAFAVIAGHRRGTLIDGGALSLSMYQFEADLLLPLTSHLGVHANVKPERVMKDGLTPYLRGTSLAEVDWRAKLSVGAGLDWTTESAALMSANPLPTYYPFGIIRVRPSDSLVVQLFAGSQKGGLKCFGGVCRIVPPFAGTRLDVTVRF
ncbi:MAG TPA: DUF6029 family protein [Polyangia bacterium]|nr:DUF6029 family protein [Polyangia bacterium]